MKLPKDDPVILTQDGLCFQPRNIEVIDCGRENGVHVVCLPSHGSLKLQLVDVSCLQPLKTYYAEKPPNQSCYILSNYWTGWENLLEIGHSSHCCKRVPEKQSCLSVTVTCLVNMILE